MRYLLLSLAALLIAIPILVASSSPAHADHGIASSTIHTDLDQVGAPTPVIAFGVAEHCLAESSIVDTHVVLDRFDIEAADDYAVMRYQLGSATPMRADLSNLMRIAVRYDETNHAQMIRREAVPMRRFVDAHGGKV